jgi:dCTP deaminase
MPMRSVELSDATTRSGDTGGDMLMRRIGVLPRQAIRRAIEAGWIASDAEIPDRNMQPASLDLTLGPKAYRLRCSFLPGSRSVRDKLREYQMEELDLRAGAVLEQNRPYLIPLSERVTLPADIRARANPRSSTGRLDVFTRVVVDNGQHFDEIPPGYSGELFLEVVPRSFTIKVRSGQTLNQLRLIAGSPRVSDDELIALHDAQPLVFAGEKIAPGEAAVLSDGLFLSVDLSRRKGRVVGYRAKRSSALLDLDRIGQYEVPDFWERLHPDRAGRLILEPEEFYLLVSRERVRVPPGLAAEMAAYDPTAGELRTHYAGFFDPGFGYVGQGERQGTPAVLEVRAHDVAFALEHGQRLCKLTFETMQEAPDQAYGATIGSSYQRQYLALGRQFKPDRGAQLPPSDGLMLFAEEPMALERIVDGGPGLAMAHRDAPSTAAVPRRDHGRRGAALTPR